MAASARIEPQLASLTHTRQNLQNEHNRLTGQVSLYENQVKLGNAQFRQYCGNNLPPPARPSTTTAQRQMQQQQQQLMNGLVEFGINRLINRGGSSPSNGGCPPGYHPRRDGQPGCHKN